MPRATVTKEKRKDAVVADGEEQKRNYELVLVLNPNATDDKFEAMVKGFSQNIVALGGEISEVEQWGRRKLAYQIKGFADGYYVLLRFVLKPSQSNVLDGKLRISEEIIRHMLVKIEG